MANWYGVYTRPRCEKKVVEALSKKKIEHYCPMNRTYSNWGGRRKILCEPVFNSYVFVRLNVAQLEEVRKINGVINLIFWMGKPAVIRDIEIEMIKRFLNEHRNVQLEKTVVNVHEIVKVATNPAPHSDDEETIEVVKLTLPSLGYALLANVAHKKEEAILQSDVHSYRPSLLKIS